VTARRCVYCHEDVGVVLWVFDGVSDEPVPACRDCRDRHRLSVFRVEVLDPSSLPGHPTCEDCGRALPSPDTEPAVLWVSDRRRGIVASCNACRLANGRSTLCTSAPDGASPATGRE
jgi:hypothetical protein